MGRNIGQSASLALRPGSAASAFPPGSVLLGKYVVDGVLGEGGMGIVLAVQHQRLGRPFALKLLRREFADDEAARRRFERESRATAGLRSPCIARAFDCGELADGTLYMVFERLEGKDLSQLLPRRIEPGVAVCIALQILHALADAHAASLVHRDLKTENVFVSRGDLDEPSIRVLDFGIAKDLERPTTTLEVMGTASYIAPEQLEGRRVDARADLFSLGVILHECLAGAHPFEGRALADTFAAILFHQPPPLPDGVPAGLARAVFRVLEKQPAERFGSAEEMRRALLPFLPEALADLVPEARQRRSGVGLRSRDLVVEPRPRRAAQTERPLSRTGTAAAAPRRSLGASALPVVAAAALGWLVLERDPRPPEADEASGSPSSLAGPAGAPEPAPIPVAACDDNPYPAEPIVDASAKTSSRVRAAPRAPRAPSPRLLAAKSKDDLVRNLVRTALANTPRAPTNAPMALTNAPRAPATAKLDDGWIRMALR